jgi:hypothetical protein
MSPIYGKLILGEEQHAAAVAADLATAAGVYGPLASATGEVTVTLIPEKAPDPVAELPSSPLGEDYTVQQLAEALIADPSLAKEMLSVEMSRPTGARKMALRAIIEHTVDEDVAGVAQLSLDALLAV